MEASVDPVFYFNVYSPVTCISFFTVQDTNSEVTHENILIGTSDGKVLEWSLKSRKEISNIEYSIDKTHNPILWLCTLQTYQEELLLIIQERFSNVIYILKHNGSTWCREQDFEIAEKHVGFCKGDTILNSNIVFPSGENSFEVVKVKKESFHEYQIASPNTDIKSCGTITSLKFSLLEKNETLFSSYENGDIYIYKVFIKDEKLTLEILFKYESLLVTPLSLFFDEDKLSGVVGGSEDIILSFKICMVKSKIDVDVLKKRQTSTKGVSSVLIRPDKKIVIAGSWDSTIKLFSWIHPEKLKPLGALKFHSESVDVVAAKSDSKLFAAGSKDGKISFWNVY